MPKKSPTENWPKMLRVTSAARQLNVSRTWVYLAVARGELRGRQIDGQTFVLRSDVARLLHEREQHPPQSA